MGNKPPLFIFSACSVIVVFCIIFGQLINADSLKLKASSAEYSNDILSRNRRSNGRLLKKG